MRIVQFIVTGVRSLPFTAGKHSAGVMISHQIQATALMGLDQRPKCHGPGRNLPRSKNSLSATCGGMSVNKIRCVVRESGAEDKNLHSQTVKLMDRETYGCSESRVLRDRAKSEDSVDWD